MNLQINIENPLLVLAREGVAEYQPVFRDIPLEMENVLPEVMAAVSLRNVRKLMKAGLIVKSVEAVENQHIFITFTTGETYLALGFQVGTHDFQTTALSQFLSEALGGDQKKWEKNLIPPVYDPDYIGPINPPVESVGLKIHKN